MYMRDFVEDDEFWDENCVLCDFATACRNGYSPEKDSRPVEFIIVQARFHYNARTPDEPWHITVDFGTRTTWNNGDGFFRQGYHIYAKNNDIKQGYAAYSSPINRQPVGRINRNGAEPGTSTSVDNMEAPNWIPWGTRDYYRHPNSRGYLHKTAHRSLKPPTVLSEARARKMPGDKRKKRHPIQDELDDMISCIHDGTLKPAIPAKGNFMVPGLSGDLIHVRQAVLDFKKAGKELPVAWHVVLQRFHESRRRLKKTARALGATRARLAFDKTRRTTRTTTRSREGPLKSKRLNGTERSFRPKSKMHASLDESLGARRDRPGTERPQTNGSSMNNVDGGARLKSRPRATAGSPKPKSSEATKPGSSPKLTIRDPFDTDAGARQGVSASGELDSKASRGKRFGKPPGDGKFEPKGRSRRIMRRPKGTTKDFDLGHALLNAATEPGVSTHHRQGPKANKPDWGEGSARPRTKRFQKSSLGNSLLNWGSPVSSGGGRSSPAPSSPNRRPGTSGRQESGSDTRKAGKKRGSPLPPADADLVSESGKKTKGPYKAQRPRQTRALKTTPAWVLPRSGQEATL
ncbi:hypothetical protein INS49_010591 [Diaporthe citri]|uniref:uncharacterized protein n=1 Tax=Diaporthe citri TaxID=83186 RepID=UPI001C81776D|nr:uncharacterized protein INS49_010591 [Diaporthe citri]KAG6362361.1 hypothetical protein INS49_010591 [Diaporthe citri]